MHHALLSSKSTLWETPQYFFDQLNAVYHFDIDVCALKENAKCKKYYTPEIDGLKQTWKGVCWMNPPYGRYITGRWVEKAYNESRLGGTVVALLPARTDTKWFHRFIYKKRGVTVEFLKGRLKFGNSKNSAPFPSMIVTFGAVRKDLGQSSALQDLKKIKQLAQFPLKQISQTKQIPPSYILR